MVVLPGQSIILGDSNGENQQEVKTVILPAAHDSQETRIELEAARDVVDLSSPQGGTAGRSTITVQNGQVKKCCVGF